MSRPARDRHDAGRAFIARTRGNRIGRQRGQALVFATVALAAVLLVLLVLFSSAQLSSERMELQNTADATAYTVATIAARDYNFSAYMNRAMVANQVTVGQVVGLASWNEMVAQVIEDIEILCDIALAGAGGLCTGVKQVWNTYKDTYQKTVAPALTKGLGAWIKALSTVQDVFHYAMAEAMLQNLLPTTGGVVQEGVLGRNDPDASLLRFSSDIHDVPDEVFRFAALAKGVADWWSFSHAYDPSAGAKDKDKGKDKSDDAAGLARFVEVVEGNRDGFLEARNWGGTVNPVKLAKKLYHLIADKVWGFIRGLLPSWIPTKFLSGIINTIVDFVMDHLPLSAITLEVTRAGGTELKQGGEGLDYAWASVDTLQFKVHVDVNLDIPYPNGISVSWRCVARVFGHCVLKVPDGISFSWGHKTIHFGFAVPVPLGWGASIAKAPELKAADLAVYKAGDYKAEYGGSFAKNPEASELAITMRNASLTGYQGLTRFRDVKDPDKHKSVDGPAFLFVVSKDRGKIRTAQVAGLGAPEEGRSIMGLPALRLAEPSNFKQMYALAKAGLRYGKDGEYANLFNPYWEARLVEVSDTERAIALEASAW